MKKLALLFILPLVCATADAAIVFSDDFSSYSAGESLWNGPWNPKWDGGDTTQRNLWTGSGTGTAVFDLNKAKRLYYNPSNVGWSLTGTDYATIQTDWRYTHAAGGNITTNLNDGFFGLGVSTTTDWWSGTNDTVATANRGSAIGQRLDANPWVEGWLTHSSLGVNTTTGGTSNWLTLKANYVVSGGNYWVDQDIYNGSTLLFDGTSEDTGIAAGTTVYAMMQTPWLTATDTIEDHLKISQVEIDNFSVDVVPEPSSIALVGLGLMGLLARRRRR